MSLFVLDTDILSLYQHGHPQITSNVHRYSPAALAITVISVEESLTGWYTLVRRAQKPDAVAKAYARLANSVHFLAAWQILGYPESAVTRYENLKTLKLNVGAKDMRIAAIVLENAATLVTRNVSDFRRIPGLTTEDWSI